MRVCQVHVSSDRLQRNGGAEAETGTAASRLLAHVPSFRFPPLFHACIHAVKLAYAQWPVAFRTNTPACCNTPATRMVAIATSGHVARAILFDGV